MERLTSGTAALWKFSSKLNKAIPNDAKYGEFMLMSSLVAVITRIWGEFHVSGSKIMYSGLMVMKVVLMGKKTTTTELFGRLGREMS